MRRLEIRLVWTVLLLVVWIAAAPSMAARTGVGDENTEDPVCDGKDTDHCQGNTRSGPNGGPADCATDETSTGEGQRACLETTAQSSGYNTTVQQSANGVPSVGVWGDAIPDEPGTFEEIESYCLSETSNFIQYVEIAVDQPRLVAKISRFVERPGRGDDIVIRIYHDSAEGALALGDEITVNTSVARGNVGRLNWAVCQALKGAGLSVECLERYFVVERDSSGKSPRNVSVLVQDLDLKYLDVALEPAGGHHDITACTQIGPTIIGLPH